MKTICLNKTKNSYSFALVDDQHFDYLNQFFWHRSTQGYAVRRCKDKVTGKIGMVYMHREILGITDPKMDVDHKNGCKLDNTTENIRVCSRTQNLANNTKRKQDTSSEYKGVSLCRTGKWTVSIKNKHVRTVDSEEVAAACYNIVAKETFGEFANLNNVSKEAEETAASLPPIKEKTSHAKGVHFCKVHNKWSSRININGRRKNLGWFLTEQQAIQARNKAKEEQLMIA